jgi:hypothetical protein
MAGGVFRAEHANDVSGSPGTWVQVGTDTTISGMTNETVYIGLAVTSHNTDPTIACEARFSDVTMTGTIVGNWANRDIGIQSNKPEKLYVVLQDSDSNAMVVYSDPNGSPDANIVLTTLWTEWRIDLKDFTGVTLSDVRKMYIGIGTRGGAQPGGSGLIYVDQIVLYRPEFYPSELTQRPYDYNFDGLVDEADLDVITNNWLISDYTVTPVAPPFGPVAWYRFEQNTLDSVNSFHADPCGIKATDYITPGKEGTYCVDLKGDANFAETDSNAVKLGIDANKPRTITAWAYTRSFDGGGLYEIGQHADGRDFSLRTMDASNSWRVQQYGGAYDMDFTYPSKNVWVHFAHVYDGATVKVYANGELVAERAMNLNTAGTPKPFRVGVWGGNYFNGRIDDVRIYNYALSQAHAGYLAGRAMQYTQPLSYLLTPPDPDVDLYIETPDAIDLRDFAEFGKHWGEEQVWPTW